jgi:hypothetical protein
MCETLIGAPERLGADMDETTPYFVASSTVCSLTRATSSRCRAARPTSPMRPGCASCRRRGCCGRASCRRSRSGAAQLHPLPQDADRRAPTRSESVARGAPATAWAVRPGLERREAPEGASGQQERPVETPPVAPLPPRASMRCCQRRCRGTPQTALPRCPIPARPARI